MALVGIKEWIDGLWKFPHHVYVVATFVGISLIGLGSLLGLYVYVLFPVWIRVTSLTTQFDVVRVGWNQIDDFYSLCKELLGEDIAEIERVRQWHRKNPDTLYTIHARKHWGLIHTNKMVGLFTVFPVTSEAKQLLQRNRLKGTEFNANHITTLDRAAAIYIGAIGARGFRARQQTLMALLGYVNSLADRNIDLVFTHPITRDGARLAKQRGFEPVSKSVPEPSDMIYFRHLGAQKDG